MCGRFARTTPPEELAALVDAEPVTGLRPRYNLAPTQDALVARARHGVAGRELVQLRWGLVPHWAKDAKGAARMINARAETAGAKLAFRDAFRQRRCLVAADGWYEWRTTAAGRAPMLIQRLGPGGEVTPFFFAGLWARWRNPAAPDAPPLETFTILTREAAPGLATIHDRMPLVLAPDAYSAWLDPSLTDPGAASRILACAVLDGYSVHPVSTRVNDARNDDPACWAAPATRDGEPTASAGVAGKR